MIVGSSRVLFDIQIGVWERLDGRRPIQLALEGTSPVAVLEELASDPDFTGKLLVGVAPGLFFSGYEYRRPAIDRYRKETPSQWFGQRVSLLVEPYLAFYDSDFALPTLLRRQPLANRAGVEFEMEVRKLDNMERDRNARLWRRLEDDPAYRALTRTIWAQGWKPLAEQPANARERILKARTEQLDRAVAAARTLRGRGVPVVFAQLPYAGHYAVAEPEPDFMGFEAGPEVVRGQIAEEFRRQHREVQALAEGVRQTGIAATALLIRGPTVETTLKEAERLGADLIVVGSHGRSAVYDVLVGRYSAGILRRSPIPVLVVPTRGE